MHLTAQQQRIISDIDDDVKRIGQQAKNKQAAEEALVGIMPKHMQGFKYLLDTLDSDRMNQVCETVPGFYRFAKMMERIATGCRDGIFDDIIANSPNLK